MNPTSWSWLFPWLLSLLLYYKHYNAIQSRTLSADQGLSFTLAPPQMHIQTLTDIREEGTLWMSVECSGQADSLCSFLGCWCLRRSWSNMLLILRYNPEKTCKTACKIPLYNQCCQIYWGLVKPVLDCWVISMLWENPDTKSAPACASVILGTVQLNLRWRLYL